MRHAKTWKSSVVLADLAALSYAVVPERTAVLCSIPSSRLPVLKASGHVDRFTDFMVKDVKARAEGGLFMTFSVQLISVASDASV
jgi:hypothetical protein